MHACKYNRISTVRKYIKFHRLYNVRTATFKKKTTTKHEIDLLTFCFAVCSYVTSSIALIIMPIIASDSVLYLCTATLEPFTVAF